MKTSQPFTATPTNPGSNPFRYGSSGSTHRMERGEVDCFHPGKPLYPNCRDEFVQKKFVVQGYQDIWAAVLFLCVVGVSVAVGTYHFPAMLATIQQKAAASSTSAPNTPIWSPLLLTISLSIALAALSMFMLKSMAYTTIVVTNVAFLCLFVVLGIKYMGIWGAILGTIHALYLFAVRNRMRLSAAFMSHSAGVVSDFWGVIVCSFVASFAMLMYVPFWASTSHAMHVYWKTSHTGQQGEMPMFPWAVSLFMLFWVSQLTASVVHTITSGTVATWYFAGPLRVPHSPTQSSAKRCLTTSFGSLCFGSLIEAILAVIRSILSRLERKRDGAEHFLLMIAECLVQCLENLVEYFNLYAYTYIAMYGMSYIESGKAAWELVKNCGISAIINDNLVSYCVVMICLWNSVATSLVVTLSSSGELGMAIATFAISYVVQMMVLRVVLSGVMTLLVCFAEAPEASVMNQELRNDLNEGLEALREPICC